MSSRGYILQVRDKQNNQSNSADKATSRPIEDSASNALNQSSGISPNLISSQVKAKPLIDEGVFAGSSNNPATPAAVKPAKAAKFAGPRSHLLGLLSVAGLLVLATVGLVIAYNAYRTSFEKVQRSRVSNSIDTTSVDLGSSALSGGQEGISLLQVNGDANITGNITANTFNGSGADLTNLNADNITTGTLDDARLSANVALLDATQTFTGNNTFAGSNSYSGSSNFSGPSTFTGTLTLPGTITINSNTYAFPAAQGVGALTNDGAGNLVWQAIPACPTCILDGGNSFGAAIAIGTNDNFDLTLRTNGITRLTFDTTGNANFAGTITSGTINGQTISNAANFTGTMTVAGSSLTLGTASTTTGNLVMRSSSGTGSITLAPANTGNSTFNITFPAQDGTVCTTGSVCSGYAPVGGGSNYIQNQSAFAQVADFWIGGTGKANIISAVTKVEANNLIPTASLTIGSTGQDFLLEGTSASTIKGVNGGNSTILGFISPTANRNIDLPNESGTICTTGSVCTGYAPASGANYLSLQNTTPGVQQTGNANISGTLIAGYFSGNGASLTSLNATSVSSGTLDDARLSANVAKLNTNQTFTGNNTFTGAVNLPGTVNINSNNYNFPALQGNGVLTNDGAGNLTWANSVACSTCITNGGNSFGATITIGSNDNNNLVFRTNSITRLTFDTTGNANFTGTIDAATAIKLNGNNINTAGTLSNVAYLDQANVFSTTNTFSAGIATNTISPNGGTLSMGSTGQAFLLEGTSASTIVGVNGGNSTTLGFIAPTLNRNINLPNESGTICTTGSVCTGYAPASGANYLSLQNTTPGVQQTGNANISGTLIAGYFSGNGASLTSLDAGNVASGTLSDSRLSSNVTVQGNSFNTANKLVQLDGSTALPAVGGALLTNLNASNIASGTLADARLSANVAKLNANQTFSGNNTFTGSLNLPAAIVINSNSYNFPGLSAGGVLTNDGSGNLTWSAATACPTCITSGGNSFGSNISIGSNDNYSLAFKTNNTTRLTFSTTGDATFTGAIIGDGTQLSGVAKTATSNTFAAANTFSAAGTALTVNNNATISGTATIGTVTTNTIASTGAMSITPAGAMTVGSTSQALTLQGSASSTITATGGGFTTTIGFTGAPGNNTTYNFNRNVGAGPYEICTTAGNCAGVGPGDVTAGLTGGTTGSIAKFSAAYGIEDSLLSESGTTVTMSGDLKVSDGSNFISLSGTTLSVYDSVGGTTTNYTFPADGNGPYKICTDGPASTCGGGGGGGANAALSNLASVAINTSLLPGSVNTVDLGSSAKPFRDIYIGDAATNNIKLSGTATGARTITFPNESGTVCTTGSICSGYASNSLDNLSSVAINADLKPGTAGATSLGAASKPFANFYLAGSSLDPANDYFMLTGTPSGGVRTITLPNASGTVCLENSASCGFAASTGSTGYIQNQNASDQTANFRISGTGKAATLNATTAIQLAGVSINTGGTLSNVAYLDQANTFTAAGTALTVNNNATISGTLTSGAINGQTISNSANFTGTMTVAGSSLTLGTAGATTGNLVMRSSSGTGSITLTPANTGNSTFNITFPAQDGTVCTTGSVCSGYAPSGSYANTQLSNLGSTAINADLTFSSTGDPARSIVGPGLNGMTLTNAGGNLTVSTTAAGTLALSSAGVISITGADDSTIGVGGSKSLSITSSNFNVAATGTMELGKSGSITGAIKLHNATASSGAITLAAANTSSNNYTITFPNETGTVCTTTTVCSGYAPSSGGNNYIQNQSASAQTADFWISGTGKAANLNATTAIQLAGVSINDGGTLSNVAYLDQSNTFSATGTATFTASGTALTVNNTASIGTVATNTITPSSSLTIGAVGQQFTLQGTSTSVITAKDGSNTTTLYFATPTTNRSITFPNQSGTVCTSTDSGGALCSGYAPATGGDYANKRLSNLDTLLGTEINVNLNFSTVGNPSRSIVGPGTGGLTLTNDAGDLTVSTTTSGNLALSSAGAASITGGGAVNITGGAASTWSLGSGNALTITSSNFNVAGGQLTLGKPGPSGSNGSILIHNATNADTIALTFTAPASGPQTIIFPDESGTVCTTATAGACNTSPTGYFQNGGNSFGATAYLGTADGNDLAIRTGVGLNTAQTRFTFSSGAVTLTGNGATTLTSNDTMTLSSGTNKTLTIDSGGTGAINFGTSANAKTITIGNTTGATALVLNSGATGAVNINTDGSSSGVVSIGNGTGTFALDSSAFDVTTAGALSGITGITQGSGNFAMSGTGTFGTGTGAVSLNGNTTVTGSNTLTVSSGLTTLSGGLTATGTTNINATGSANTTIGNSTGTFQLDSSAFDVTTAGALSGITTISTSGTINSATISGGSLSATAVNTLLVSGTAITGTGALAIDANTTNTIDIGATSTGNINLGGGSSSTGCTVTNSNGNFACSGTGTFNGTSTANMFVQGGNSFGATAYLGTTDANDLVIRTGSGTNVNQTRFTFSSSASTLTGSGATTLTSTGEMTLSSAAASNLTLSSGTTGAVAIDSGTSGTITIGGGTDAKTVNLGTGGAGVKTIAIGGTADNVITIGNTQTAGSVSMGNAMTTGTITLGGTIQTGLILIGQSIKAQDINIGSAGSTEAAQVIRIGGGTTTTGGSKQVNIANGAASAIGATNTVNIATTAPVTGASNTVNIATGGVNTGTMSVNIGSDGAAAHTLVLKGGNGTALGSEAIRIATEASGNIAIGTATHTGSISIGATDANGSTVNIGTGTGAQAINLGTGGTGIKTIAIGGTADNVITIGNTQTAGSVSMGNAMTTGTITLGGLAMAATSSITIGATNANGSTVNIGTGTGNQTLNFGTGVGVKTVTVGSTNGTSALTLQSGSGNTTLTTPSVTLSNDTNFVLSGGVNGISFDGTTLSIDATNDRVGISTATPASKLDIIQTASVTTSATVGINTSEAVLTLNGLNPTTYGTLYGTRLGTMSLSPLRLGQTVTEAATLSIGGVPYKTAGGPLFAFSTAYGIKIDQNINASGAANAYGLYVDAPTGAGNNYAASFVNGNVGIGTTAPAQKLEVNGTAAFIDNIQTGQSAIDVDPWATSTINLGGYGSIGTQGSNGTYMAWNYSRVAPVGGVTTYQGLGVAGLTAAGHVAITNSGIDFAFQTTAPTTALPTLRMRLSTAGELLTGGATDNGAYNLQSNGTGVWGAGAYVNGSDRNLKQNIESLDSGLDVLTKIRAVTFNWKPDYNSDPSLQTGFIAQELQEAMTGKPYLDGVVVQGPEFLSVAYQNIIPIAVKGIQELNTKVDTMQSGLSTSVLAAIADANAITVSGTLTINGVTLFNGEVRFSADTAGSVKVPAGSTSADVTFATPFSKKPVVNATPNDFVSGGFRVVNVTPTGFSVELENAQAADKDFSWQALVTQ